MGKIKGMDSVRKLLKDLSKHTKEATQKGIMRTARLIEADAKSRVPKDLGELAAAIRVEQNDDRTLIIADKDYAAYQEFGTGKLTKIPEGYEAYAYTFFKNGKGRTKPTPFLFPATFKFQDTLAPNVDDEIQKMIDKYYK